MRSLWNGKINFALVTIPIRLFSLTNKTYFHMHILHRKCKTQIKEKLFCPHCHKDITRADTVKGYEISKGHYVVLENKDLEKLKAEDSDEISIQEFIDIESIDPIYFDNPYFVSPQEKNDKAYFLFKTALEQSGRSAIGTFVMRDKEQLCCIKPYENGLILFTLNYAYEIKDLSEFGSSQKKTTIKKQELVLAAKIIDQYYSKTFDISKYKDQYAQKFKKLIKKYEAGEFVAEKQKTTIKKRGKQDLLKTLKASIK